MTSDTVATLWLATRISRVFGGVGRQRFQLGEGHQFLIDVQDQPVEFHAAWMKSRVHWWEDTAARSGALFEIAQAGMLRPEAPAAVPAPPPSP